MVITCVDLTNKYINNILLPSGRAAKPYITRSPVFYMTIELSSSTLDSDILEIPTHQLDVTYPTTNPLIKIHIWYSKSEGGILCEPFQASDLNSSQSIKKTVLNRFKGKIVGFKKIEYFLLDPNIEQITIDGKNHIWVYHRIFELIRVNSRMTDNEIAHIFANISKISSNFPEKENVVTQIEFPEGSWIEVAKFKTHYGKHTLTLTKVISDNPPSIIDYIDQGTLSVSMAALLWLLIEHQASILVVGREKLQSGAFLDSLIDFIIYRKIISIGACSRKNLENVPIIELCGNENTITDELFNRTRGIFSSSCTLVVKSFEMGNQLSMSSKSLHFFPSLLVSLPVSMSPLSVLFSSFWHTPSTVPLSDLDKDFLELLSQIDLIIHLSRARLRGKNTWRIERILEIVGIERSSNELLCSTAYEWNPFEDTFRFTGRLHLLETLEREKGISMLKFLEDLGRKKQVLTWMQENQVRSYRDVAETIAEYYKDPDAFLAKIEGAA